MIKPLGAISGDRRQAPSPDVSTSLLPHDAALSRRARRAAILGRIGLDLSPRDQPDMACSRVGDRHRRAGRGLHRRRSALGKDNRQAPSDERQQQWVVSGYWHRAAPTERRDEHLNPAGSLQASRVIAVVSGTTRTRNRC